MKKVLFVQHAGVGGAAVSLSQIVRKLDRGRFEPFALLLRNDSVAIEILRSCGANVIVDNQLAQSRQHSLWATPGESGVRNQSPRSTLRDVCSYNDRNFQAFADRLKLIRQQS